MKTTCCINVVLFFSFFDDAADLVSPTPLTLNIHWKISCQSGTATKCAASNWLCGEHYSSSIGYCICHSEAGQPPWQWRHILPTPFLLGSSRVQSRTIRFRTGTSNDTFIICLIESSGRRDTSTAVTRTHNVVRKLGLGLSAELWGRETGGFFWLLFECCWLAAELAASCG